MYCTVLYCTVLYLHVLLVDVMPQVGELPVTVWAGLGLAAAARTRALHTRVKKFSKPMDRLQL